MSKLSNKQSDVMGKLAAVNTLLGNYPTLTTSDPLLTNFSINSSIGFMLSILEVFGVTQADIVNWICKLLGTEEGKSDCILDSIEFAIKAILLANVKSLFTCTVNPLLPDNIMKYAVQQGSRPDPYDPTINPLDGDAVKDCIEIKIGDIDLFGLLANCPSDREGGVFYFDASEPSIEVRDPDTKQLISFTPNYTPGELWKSRDFNAFLWYVINKGNIGSPQSIQKNTWDNRVQAYKYYADDDTMKNNFFHINFDSGAGQIWPPINTPNIPISGGTPSNQTSTIKKQIIICQYSEHTNSSSNVLKVWINADRYYKTRHLRFYKGKDSSGNKKYGYIDLNRTIFEFNYDYIYSLKLFDTKTLIANIINSLLGLASSISVSASFNFEMQLTKKKVEKIVENIIHQDDTQSEDDCYYTFDNSTYNTLLQETTDEYTGTYNSKSSTYDPRFDNVFDALRGIDSTAQQQSGTTVTSHIADTLQTIMDISADDAGIQANCKLAFSMNFISDFLKQTIVQIVLQVLSPKVAVLYAINSSVMGGEAANLKEWETFIKNSQNLIVTIVRQVKDIIVKELYNFMMEKLSPILKLFINKIALETIKDYKDLITNLILNCIPNINFSLFGRGPTTIDNINYADIVPNKTIPTTKPC